MQDGTSIAAYLPLGTNNWFRHVALKQRHSEGYPTGEYLIDGISKETLQELADWMVGLPPDMYRHVEQFSKTLERFLVSEYCK